MFTSAPRGISPSYFLKWRFKASGVLILCLYTTRQQHPQTSTSDSEIAISDVDAGAEYPDIRCIMSWFSFEKTNSEDRLELPFSDTLKVPYLFLDLYFSSQNTNAANPNVSRTPPPCVLEHTN